MYEHLLFEIKDSIAYITINNPKSLNALNTATLTELNKCLAQLEKRKDARVVIVTGSGAKAFVAGISPRWSMPPRRRGAPWRCWRTKPSAGWSGCLR